MSSITLYNLTTPGVVAFGCAPKKEIEEKKCECTYYIDKRTLDIYNIDPKVLMTLDEKTHHGWKEINRILRAEKGIEIDPPGLVTKKTPADLYPHVFPFRYNGRVWLASHLPKFVGLSFPLLSVEINNLKMTIEAQRNFQTAMEAVSNLRRSLETLATNTENARQRGGKKNIVTESEKFQKEINTKLEEFDRKIKVCDLKGVIDDASTLKIQIEGIIKELQIPSLKAPTNVRVFNITQNSANVRWDSSKGADSYVAIYGTDKNNLNLTAKALKPKTVLSGLGKNTVYYVAVKGIGRDGQEGSPSDIIQFKTKTGEVSPPRPTPTPTPTPTPPPLPPQVKDFCDTTFPKNEADKAKCKKECKPASGEAEAKGEKKSCVEEIGAGLR